MAGLTPLGARASQAASASPFSAMSAKAERIKFTVKVLTCVQTQISFDLYKNDEQISASDHSTPFKRVVCNISQPTHFKMDLPVSVTGMVTKVIALGKRESINSLDQWPFSDFIWVNGSKEIGVTSITGMSEKTYRSFSPGSNFAKLKTLEQTITVSDDNVSAAAPGSVKPKESNDGDEKESIAKLKDAKRSNVPAAKASGICPWEDKIKKTECIGVTPEICNPKDYYEVVLSAAEINQFLGGTLKNSEERLRFKGSFAALMDQAELLLGFKDYQDRSLLATKVVVSNPDQGAGLWSALTPKDLLE